MIACGARSFSLSEVSIRIVPDGSTGMGDQFRAAAFDEIAGFGDDALQDIESLPRAGFSVDEFGK